MLKNKKTQLVSLYFVYLLKKNASITDIFNDDQNTYVFAPTYGDGYTDFHRNIISVVVFFYSDTFQGMLVDYTITKMGYFYDYLNAAPHAKKMTGNCITTFLLHVVKCITFNQTKNSQQHLFPRHR